jgi:hypothetical protein
MKLNIPIFLCVCVTAAAEVSWPKLSGDLVWSGSWEDETSVVNRGDARLGLPQWGLTLRGQILDKRDVPPWENPDSALTVPGGGLYHQGTASRLLYGSLEESGLGARLRNIWTHSASWVESHKSSNSDLRTTPVAEAEAATYLYLGSPALALGESAYTGFAAVLLDKETNAAFSGGLNARFPRNQGLHLEGYLYNAALPERAASGWFSDKTYLPERDFLLYAGSAVFTHPFFSGAFDIACSEVFAYGKDIYANMGLRVGKNPLTFSLAIDGAGSRFVGSNGTASGAGARGAAKAEWQGTRDRLLRASTTLRAPAWGEDFDRSSSTVYYRFPRGIPWPVQPSRVSLGLSRNAADTEKISDSLDFLIGLNYGPLRGAFTVAADGIATNGPFYGPYPSALDEHEFSLAKFGGEVSWPVAFFQFKAAATYTKPAQKDPSFAVQATTTVRGKLGRLSLKLSHCDNPEDWSYALSWRVEKKW